MAPERTLSPGVASLSQGPGGRYLALRGPFRPLIEGGAMSCSLGLGGRYLAALSTPCFHSGAG